MHNKKFKTVVSHFLIYLIGIATSNSYSQEIKQSQQTNSVKPALKTSLLAQSLANIGAFSCTERANQISNFLAPDGQAEIVMQTPKDSVNNRLLMSSMVIKENKEQNIVASLALAPNQINGCGGSYRTIFYTPVSCSEASTTNFPKEKFQTIGKTNTQIAVINRALWVISIPADKGCIFIKEEIIE